MMWLLFVIVSEPLRLSRVCGTAQG